MAFKKIKKKIGQKILEQLYSKLSLLMKTYKAKG